MAESKQSLYERAGGQAAIMAAVDLFYEKVIADEVTRPYFAGLDLRAQVRKQTAFMAWALGGPAEYKGRDLRAAHAELVRHRGLKDIHFDAVARHLQDTLHELSLADDLIAEIMAVIASTRTEVLGR
jgi:hemoglobin